MICLNFSDIIFFIFLYQRWIYRVDPSRVNEFGVSQEMLEAHQTTTQPTLEPVGEQETMANIAKPIEEKKNEWSFKIYNV